MQRPPKRHAVHRPVVWVVGASRGIGKDIAKQFAAIGCEVAISSRMMQAKSVAKTVLAIYQMPDDVVVDQIVIRPIQGDIE